MAICWFVGPLLEACRGQTLAQRWPVGHAGGVSLWQLDATWQRLGTGRFTGLPTSKMNVFFGAFW